MLRVFTPLLAVNFEPYTGDASYENCKLRFLRPLKNFPPTQNYKLKTPNYLTLFNGKYILPPLRLTFLMWGIFTFELYLGLDLGFLGIYPRSLHGLIGILTAPMIHGSVLHITSNTFPLLFLGSSLYYFYDKIAARVFLQCYLFTGVLVWIFARPFYHVGASGLIYGLAFFLISFGLFRKDFKSLLISIIVVLLYGGIIYGLFPNQPGVSWESHALGAVVGISTASTLSKVKRVSSG